MIFTARAYLADGWAENVRLTLQGERIANVETGVEPDTDDFRVDTLLPAIANLHSHAFQRAMAGLTEFRSVGRDSFWSWRTLMYRFLDRLTPDHLTAIAAMAYMEMQEAGYASVGEFHYLHHDIGGSAYGAPAETSRCIFEAARRTGIGLTHLPVLYTYGGAERQALSGGQKRFGNDWDGFAALVDDAAGAMAGLPSDTRLGIAPHSLRAVDPDLLERAAALRPGEPIHMHIAEQPAEVEQIESWLGARPVGWLLNNMEVDRRWCLIHATHMTDRETVRLARSGAVAGLCPITEANLGDGPFNGPSFLNEDGAFGIGSDSNVRIALGEELRMLEYSQRLRDRLRNVFAKGERSVGETLYAGAAAGGAQALGRGSGCIEPGALADLVAIDSQSPSLCHLPESRLLDGLVFAAGANIVTDLWSAGRQRVRQGRHIHRETIIAEFRTAMRSLTASH